MAKDYKEILAKMFARCKLKPGYKVFVYLKDKSKLDILSDMAEEFIAASKYVEENGEKSGVKRVKGVKFGVNNEENRAKFEFANSSSMEFGVSTSFSREEKCHVALFDRDLRQSELDLSLCSPIPYQEIGCDMQVWNPDPIKIAIIKEIGEQIDDSE